MQPLCVAIFMQTFAICPHCVCALSLLQLQAVNGKSACPFPLWGPLLVSTSLPHPHHAHAVARKNRDIFLPHADDYETIILTGILTPRNGHET
jgi:hypothetical protein